MYARVARYDVPAGRTDDAVEAFREAARTIEQLPGLQAGYVMVDHENGRVITATFWENRAALEASEVRASRARQDAVRTVDGECTSIDRLEVAIELAAGEGPLPS